MHNEYQTKMKEMNFQEQIRSLNEEYHNELKTESQKLAMLQDEKEALGAQYNQRLRELKARDEKAMHDFAIAQEKRLKAEKERYCDLQVSHFRNFLYLG
jgi:hypothetical protein